MHQTSNAILVFCTEQYFTSKVSRLPGFIPLFSTLLHNSRHYFLVFCFITTQTRLPARKMTEAKDSFATLERHIELLEENIEKLSNALSHWRQWKDEYEALREDVDALPQSPSREDLSRTREGFHGKLVEKKELVEIFGKNDSKKPEQIKSILTNRLDYVTKNIQTLEKQVETAQNKLAAATVVSNPDAATDEDGLPIMEIMEELDDDDNVISYNLRAPGGDSQSKLLETLGKMGIKEEDLPEDGSESLDDAPTNGDTSTTKQAEIGDVSQPPAISEPTSSKQALPPNTTKDLKPSPLTSSQNAEELKGQDTSTESEVAPKKKGVSFAEDTKSGDEGESETSKRLVEILRKARDEQGIIEDPVMPADDSPEDAALREDMIRYNKETMEYEMAPIVAELNLEEGSDIDTDEYSDFYDDDDEDDDDEDQWGRSTNAVVDDDWKRQMLELKERLSRQAFGAEKPSADDEDGDGVEGIGRIAIRHEKPPSSEQLLEEGDKTQKPMIPSTNDNGNGKKGVRFAPTLDIAEEPAPPPPPASAQAAPVTKAVVDPLSDVMERSGGTTGATPNPNKKLSRFRKERAHGGGGVPTFQGIPLVPEQPSEQDQKFAPSGPEGRTLATSVLEHEPSQQVREPDELDASLVQQQVAEEYHRARNRLIHKQGGFLREDERAVRPLEEEEGGPRRVSRFKAARLAGS